MRTTAGETVPSQGRRGDYRLPDENVRVPQADVTLLQRSRVSRLIDDAVRHRVTLLTGPAGAGKTVACAAWAATRRAPSRPAWLTVDPQDADPGRLFGSVTAALGRAAVITADQAKDLAGLAPAQAPEAIGAATAARGEPAVLVLDDAHRLASGPAAAALTELVKHGGRGLRLVLSGRRPPGVPLGRLRVSGELADIGGAELAGTSDEVSAYFAATGRSLSAAELDQAMQWTEGWMAGLRLMSLGANAGEARAQSMLADYLWDEVLTQLPARSRGLLLRTSLTPTVPVQLARVLTGEPDAARLLDQLSRSNGLVQVVHPDEEYRYHPMLRAVLSSALQHELPDDVPGLLHRVALWHADRGDVLLAEQAAAGTGDWDFGLRLLHDAGPAPLVSGDGPELERVLGGFPADRRVSDTVLAVALAAARLWQGDADGALPHLESAEAGLARLAGPEARPMRLWLAALRVMCQSSLPGVGGADWLRPYWSLAATAHENARLAPEHDALGLLWLALGCAALRDLDAHRARTALLHTGSQLSAAGNLALRERARAWDAVASAWYGDLAAADRLAASVTDGPLGQDAALAPVIAVAAAVGHLARGEPAAAASLLDRAELAAGSAQPAGEPQIAVLTGLLRTRLAIAEGNLAGARGLVRWLTEVAAESDGVRQLLVVMRAEISLACGERERARSALAGGLTGPLPGSGPGSERSAGSAGPRPGLAICQARVLIADDDDKGALALVEPLLAEPALAGRPAADADGAATLADRLAALLTAAVAHRRLGQAAEAADQLEEALALAEPDEACGAFVAAGAPIRAALTVLTSPTSRCAAFAGRILACFEDRLPRSAGSSSSAPLTESELAVLRFLPSHMTNQEIADSLFLSINTIKTHLSSVYRKLGVPNRRQAIAQGRKLDLLLASGLTATTASLSAGRPPVSRPGAQVLAASRGEAAAPSLRTARRMPNAVRISSPP